MTGSKSSFDAIASTLNEQHASIFSPTTISRDLTAGLVVFLVALPLCLGVALASGAPLFSGLLAGIIGGVVVGALSRSHTSVSGPAAGLTAIVATQIAALGSFEAFLLAVVVGGVIQISLGVARAGALSAFFPSSVIKGLLAAIGIILILKQIPHVVGYETDPSREVSISQLDEYDTLSGITTPSPNRIHPGAAAVGIFSIALLLLWNRLTLLKKTIPGSLVVVLVGVFLHLLLQRIGDSWAISPKYLVQIPVADTARDLFGFLRFPDFSQWAKPAIYTAGLTIAVVASLETLLNLEAVDKLDTERRDSPPSRELVAQGVGNIVAGKLLSENQDVHRATGCAHIHAIVSEIAHCVNADEFGRMNDVSPEEKEAFIDEVAERNVLRTVHEIVERSAALRHAMDAGQIMVIGALYDVKSGKIEFLLEEARPHHQADSQSIG